MLTLPIAATAETLKNLNGPPEPVRGVVIVPYSTLTMTDAMMKDQQLKILQLKQNSFALSDTPDV